MRVVQAEQHRAPKRHQRDLQRGQAAAALAKRLDQRRIDLRGILGSGHVQVEGAQVGPLKVDGRRLDDMGEQR
jgi:hypothetical protein